MTDPKPLESKPIAVGLITLPVYATEGRNLTAASETVEVHLTEQTQQYLEKLMAQIPTDKKGQLRLVIDWKQIGGLNAEGQVAAHLGEPTVFGRPADVDGAAIAGWSKPSGAYYGAELRIEF